MNKFPQRLQDKIYIEPNSGCWLWLGSLSNGYGQTSLYQAGKRDITLHRLAYELYKGEIPAGLEIDHLCRIRCCCNPDHLEAVTHLENQIRASEWRDYLDFF